MSEEDRCPELCRLYRFLQLEKPIPDDFMEHAGSCEHCFFWLSFSLAAQKALLTTTPRFFIDEENCPPREEFQALLILALRALKTNPLLNVKTASSWQNVVQSDIREFLQLWTHLSYECELCRDYYYQLYDKTVEFQKEYGYAIKNKGRVVPVIEDATEEIPLAGRNFLPAKDGTKPN